MSDTASGCARRRACRAAGGARVLPAIKYGRIWSSTRSTFSSVSGSGPSGISSGNAVAASSKGETTIIGAGLRLRVHCVLAPSVSASAALMSKSIETGCRARSAIEGGALPTLFLPNVGLLRLTETANSTLAAGSGGEGEASWEVEEEGRGRGGRGDAMYLVCAVCLVR